MADHDSIDVKIEEDCRSSSQYLGLLPICVLLIIIFVRVSFVLCKNYVCVTISTMDIVATILIGAFMFMTLYLFWFWFCFGNCVKRRQKTRTPAQRRMYVGSRARQSLSQAEPTIYVSPANLPPPPKYECLAPPSYEEVVGIHYPQYQSQPITQPIAAAMAQSSTDVNVTSNVNVASANDSPTTVITVTSEARTTSVQVAAS